MINSNTVHENTASLVIDYIHENIDRMKAHVQKMDAPTKETMVVHNVAGKHLFIKFNTRTLDIVEVNFLGGEHLGNIQIALTDLEPVGVAPLDENTCWKEEEALFHGHNNQD